MTDALPILAKLQSVRVLRARRDLDARRRSEDKARGDCVAEEGRLEQLRRCADTARREISRTCLDGPVSMTRIQRMMDNVGAAEFDVQCSETRLRRVRILIGRLEQARREAWAEFSRCEARQRALEQRHEKATDDARRRSIAVADEASQEDRAPRAQAR